MDTSRSTRNSGLTHQQIGDKGKLTTLAVEPLVQYAEGNSGTVFKVARRCTSNLSIRAIDGEPAGKTSGTQRVLTTVGNHTDSQLESPVEDPALISTRVREAVAAVDREVPGQVNEAQDAAEYASGIRQAEPHLIVPPNREQPSTLTGPDEHPTIHMSSRRAELAETGKRTSRNTTHWLKRRWTTIADLCKKQWTVITDRYKRL